MPISPTTLFSGTTGPRGDRPGPDRVVGRMAMYAVAVVLFPLTVCVFFGWLALFVYARMPWWVPVPVAVVLWLAYARSGDPAAALTSHASMWADVVGGFGSPGGFFGWLVGNTPGLLAAQFWLAAIAGTTGAAFVAGWKWARRPRWEERLLRPGPFLRARAKRTAAAIAAGQESPSDGVTVGVAVDRRDPRFAGGKPGAPYGRRAVLRDAEGAGHCLIVGGAGAGKSLYVGTPVPLASGGFVAMGDVQPGDVLLDERMAPAVVLAAYPVRLGRPCFEVEFSDGSVIVADAEHLWRVRVPGGSRWEVLTTVEVSGCAALEVPEVRDGDAVARPARQVVSVRPTGSVPVRCIAVDSPNRVFLAGEAFIPTHNTTTMLIGMRDVIRRGHGLVVIDCKGGPDVPEQISEWASRYGRRFLHWELVDPRAGYAGPADGPAFYDPIGRGDPSRRKDLIIGSQRWDVEYYKTVIGDYLQTAFTVMALVPPPGGTDTLTDLSELLSPPALMRRAGAIPRERYPALALALERIGNMGDQERSGINNMFARLNTLTASIAGSWLRLDPSGERDIDLLRVADAGDVVVFSLDTSNYEETSALLAGLIVQDLKTVSSALREQPAATPLHVYIDEFSAVDATNVYGLLAKARDARMPVTLATQALADLKRREAHFDSQVVGIVGSFLVHRANSEEDATVYAGLSGMTRKMLHRMGVENSTGTLGTIGAASATGSGFLEEKEMYRVDPGVFQRLQQGQCVMIAKMPQERYIAPVQVIREDPVRASVVADGAVNPDRVARSGEAPAPDETFQPVSSAPVVVADAPAAPSAAGGPRVPARPPVPGRARAAGAPLPALQPVRPVEPARPARPARRAADSDRSEEWTTP